MKQSDLNHCKINREFRRAQKMGQYQNRDITTLVVMGFLAIITALVIIGNL